jgi:hypothetical protein
VADEFEGGGAAFFAADIEEVLVAIVEVGPVALIHGGGADEVVTAEIGAKAESAAGFEEVELVVVMLEVSPVAKAEHAGHLEAAIGKLFLDIAEGSAIDEVIVDFVDVEFDAVKAGAGDGVDLGEERRGLDGDGVEGELHFGTLLTTNRHEWISIFGDGEGVMNRKRPREPRLKAWRQGKIKTAPREGQGWTGGRNSLCFWDGRRAQGSLCKIQLID